MRCRLRCTHPNAALLFTDFLMSVEGQTILNRGISASPLEAVDDDLDMPQNAITVKPVDLLAIKDELLNAVAGK